MGKLWEPLNYVNVWNKILEETFEHDNDLKKW